MSDKEHGIWELIRKIADLPAGRNDTCVLSRIDCQELVAVECRAPAPQPADEIVEGLLLRGIEYCAELADEGTPWESVAEPEPQYFATFLEAYDFQIEMAATPQVTPCDHFWRTIPVGPRWSWFTECEKCKIGAPLELQAENYVEGTSEQASPAPDKCPTCGSSDPGKYNWSFVCGDPLKRDSWHSSAVTQKGTK